MRFSCASALSLDKHTNQDAINIELNTQKYHFCFSFDLLSLLFAFRVCVHVGSFVCDWLLHMNPLIVFQFFLAVSFSILSPSLVQCAFDI